MLTFSPNCVRSLSLIHISAEAEDYTGEDGLLYCGKCHTPKEAYFAEGKTCFGRDRHPTDCDCQRAAREKQQDVYKRQVIDTGVGRVLRVLQFLQREVGRGDQRCV